MEWKDQMTGGEGGGGGMEMRRKTDHKGRMGERKDEEGVKGQKSSGRIRKG